MDFIDLTIKMRIKSFKFWLYILFVGLVIVTQGQGKESIIQKFYNYPNPFQRRAEQTHITYEVKKPATGVIKIFDLNGSLVWQKTINVAPEKVDIENVCDWNGTTSTGQVVSPGVYLCVFKIKVSEKSIDLYETRTLKIGVKR